jgi:hypothetical protein
MTPAYEIKAEENALQVIFKTPCPESLAYSFKTSLVNILQQTQISTLNPDDFFFYCELLKAFTLDENQFIKCLEIKIEHEKATHRNKAA